MAGASGRSTPDLIEELLREPEQFDFFQAVRLLEQAIAEQDRARRAVRVGQDDGPQQEPVRFRALASLSFPAGDIADIRTAPAPGRRSVGNAEPDAPSTAAEAKLEWPVEMTVPFMGLTGPNGVLPQHYTSLLIERSHLRSKDYALREFFDLFNHRAISLYYRAWEKYRFQYAFERCLREGLPESDLFTTSLFCLVGMGHRPLRHRFRFDDHAILYFGGLFAARTRNAGGLSQCLSSYFGLHVTVEQFCGRWLYLPEECQSAMPSVHHRGGLNCSLGENTVVGSQVWDVQSRIRIVIGPLSWAEFQELMPGSSRLASISELIRFYVGVELDFDVQLILRRQDVPLCRLAEGGDYQPRLGWNTWSGNVAAAGSDVRDAVFQF